MKLAPIPISALPDSMSVRTPNEDGVGYKEPVNIAHVRFADVKVLQSNSYAIDDDSNGVIYVDKTNSSGAFAVPVGSLVSLDGGEELTVIKVTPYKGYDEIHHWKLEVK